jgi:hypothetical protein
VGCVAIVTDHIMMQEDFERLHKFLETDNLPEISSDLRKVIEEEWPELVYKLHFKRIDSEPDMNTEGNPVSVAQWSAEAFAWPVSVVAVGAGAGAGGGRSQVSVWAWDTTAILTTRRTTRTPCIVWDGYDWVNTCY